MSMIAVHLEGAYEPDGRYPMAICNITNRCNLACEHCFVYRDANPNTPPIRVRAEPSDADMLEALRQVRDRHGVQFMLWMGGEPLLRPSLLERGTRLFARNTITTNGTVPLLDLDGNVLYVVSLDGPEGINDALRGRGVYRRVLRTLGRIPPGFRPPVQVQCTVTRKNASRLEELVCDLRQTRAQWMTFSFYVPSRDDRTGNAWPTLEERMTAVEEVRRLKRLHPGFIRNKDRSLDLMAPDRAREVTAHCPARRYLLPLYLDRDGFRTPFCCYGNDVDCERCGAFAVFHLAALLEQGAAVEAQGTVTNRRVAGSV